MAQNITSGQCIEITDIEQVRNYYHKFRSSRSKTFDEWKEQNINKSTPFYLEAANSVYSGSSLGIIYQPVGTWSGQPLEILQP